MSPESLRNAGFGDIPEDLGAPAALPCPRRTLLEQGDRPVPAPIALDRESPTVVYGGPGRGSITWVVMDVLPEAEGEDLPLDSTFRRDFSIEEMKSWCEKNAHCVGFSHWADGRDMFHSAGWFYPKERDSGFDEDSVVWVKNKYDEQVWHWYYIKERAQLKADTALPPQVLAATSLINHDATFSPLPAESVVPFLEARGFTAMDIDANAWRLASHLQWCRWMPTFVANVRCHEEVGAHTWYTVEGTLTTPDCEQSVSWKAPRRLTHLRELHDLLKLEMGSKAYGATFVDSSGNRIQFANRGGFPGTTSRLDAWFCALAIWMNAGGLSPVAVGIVLHFLRAPPLDFTADCEAQDCEQQWPPDPQSPHPCQPAHLR